MAEGTIRYAVHNGLIVLKFSGDVRYATGDSSRLSLSVDAFLDRLFEKGDFDGILIDLTETESIDSTNLGLLARVTQFTQEHFGRKATIISTNPDINTVLDSVGFDQVFSIVRDTTGTEAQFQNVPEHKGSDEDLTRVMLNAHRTLMELNEKNRGTFQSVVRLLEAEVGK